MRTITNTNNKKLVFPKFDFAIDPEEIKIVSEDRFDELCGNSWIKEVLPEDKKDKRKNKNIIRGRE